MSGSLGNKYPQQSQQETNYTESSQHNTSYQQINDSEKFLYEAYLVEAEMRPKFIYYGQSDEIFLNLFEHQQLREYLSAIGMIRAEWKNSQDKLAFVSYGTAFAVAPRIILTCQHNIFNEQENKYANKIIFVPGINKRQIKKSTKVYKSVQKAYFKTIQLYQQTLREGPIVNELCLIVLEESLKLQKYIKIESLEFIQKGVQLQNVGYPSQSYSNQRNLTNVKPDRQILKGSALDTEGCIIEHNMKTSKGHSGSPILRVQGQQVCAIGMHTHSGWKDGQKRGLLFNKEVINHYHLFYKQITEQYLDESLNQSQLYEIINSWLENGNQQPSQHLSLDVSLENSVLLDLSSEEENQI